MSKLVLEALGVSPFEESLHSYSPSERKLLQEKTDGSFLRSPVSFLSPSLRSLSFSLSLARFLRSSGLLQPSKKKKTKRVVSCLSTWKEVYRYTHRNLFSICVCTTGGRPLYLRIHRQIDPRLLGPRPFSLAPRLSGSYGCVSLWKPRLTERQRRGLRRTRSE